MVCQSNMQMVFDAQLSMALDAMRTPPKEELYSAEISASHMDLNAENPAMFFGDLKDVTSPATAGDLMIQKNGATKFSAWTQNENVFWANLNRARIGNPVQKQTVYTNGRPMGEEQLDAVMHSIRTLVDAKEDNNMSLAMSNSPKKTNKHLSTIFERRSSRELRRQNCRFFGAGVEAPEGLKLPTNLRSYHPVTDKAGDLMKIPGTKIAELPAHMSLDVEKNPAMFFEPLDTEKANNIFATPMFNSTKKNSTSSLYQTWLAQNNALWANNSRAFAFGHGLNKTHVFDKQGMVMGAKEVLNFQARFQEILDESMTRAWLEKVM